jgi:hypothetical protein
MSEKDMNQRFTDSRKMEFVVKSWKLKGEELGRFLRENGIYSVELESWREQMSDGLKNEKPMFRGQKKILENRIRLLERELQQANAVIDLQKKVQNLFAEKEDNVTASASDQKSLKQSK